MMMQSNQKTFCSLLFLLLTHFSPCKSTGFEQFGLRRVVALPRLAAAMTQVDKQTTLNVQTALQFELVDRKKKLDSQCNQWVDTRNFLQSRELIWFNFDDGFHSNELTENLKTCLNLVKSLNKESWIQSVYLKIRNNSPTAVYSFAITIIAQHCQSDIVLSFDDEMFLNTSFKILRKFFVEFRSQLEWFAVDLTPFRLKSRRIQKLKNVGILVWTMPLHEMRNSQNEELMKLALYDTENPVNFFMPIDFNYGLSMQQPAMDNYVLSNYMTRVENALDFNFGAVILHFSTSSWIHRAPQVVHTIIRLQYRRSQPRLSFAVPPALWLHPNCPSRNAWNIMRTDWSPYFYAGYLTQIVENTQRILFKHFDANQETDHISVTIAAPADLPRFNSVMSGSAMSSFRVSMHLFPRQ